MSKEDTDGYSSAKFIHFQYVEEVGISRSRHEYASNRRPERNQDICEAPNIVEGGLVCHYMTATGCLYQNGSLYAGLYTVYG